MNNYLSHLKLPTDVNSKLEQIRFILVNLFVFFLPFDRFYTTLILFLLITTTLIDLNKEKIKSIPRQFWIYQLVFWISLSGYFYSYHKGDAGFLIERQLIIFVFPLLIPLAINVTKDRLNVVLTTFVISCASTIVLLFCIALYTLIRVDLPVSHLFSSAFFNHKFSAPIDIHAGYLSMYISLSLIYLLTRLSTKVISHKIVLVITLFILMVGLLFLASRNILIYTVIIILLFYPFFYVKRRIRFFIISLFLISIGSIFITSNQFLRKRFSISLVEDINFNKTKLNIEEIEPRSQRWLLGIELFKASPLIGHGTGEEIKQLKKGYEQKGFAISYLNNYNVHNQYLSILIKHGVLGLTLFLFAFYYYFKISFRSKHFMYFVFLFGICFAFITENVLDSNKGIFFFALFNTLFGYTILASENIKKDT